MATKTWNNIQSQIEDPMINTFSPSKLKIFLFDFYLRFYQTQGFITSSGIQVWIISVLAAFFTFIFDLAITAKSFWLFDYQLNCSK